MTMDGVNAKGPPMPKVVSSVNTISSFLADEQIQNAAALESFLNFPCPKSDGISSPNGRVVVFCASAVLSTAEAVFAWAAGRASSQVNHESNSSEAESETLVANNSSNRNQGSRDISDRITLVLVGGVGHSTALLYDAVRKHPVFHVVADDVDGKPEAAVLQAIAERFYNLSIQNSPHRETSGSEAQGGLCILVEDQSTNCGANASETRKVLEQHGIKSPHSIVVVQDPTMSRRTVASFQHTYRDIAREDFQIVSWPTFVPEVRLAETRRDDNNSPTLSSLIYKTSAEFTSGQDGLWSMDRFLDLLMGEIPRLRDDENGYGPNGRGFIGHVDVPPSVETAWATVDSFLGNVRGEGGSQRQRVEA
ncbi:hypothetical protein B0J13DRAFT_550490 [Dactylonectria estremocensis]|uniref:DUF218 domain-containing protein n=1 Tax=Dactylonectria estremocensis TaxID=1079267 RepID=A0A9P9EW96_9HYPO|nr:hypothetical protein B0J13DRAFT_550490 [Dactylonectria estremocensis]